MVFRAFCEYTSVLTLVEYADPGVKRDRKPKINSSLCPQLTVKYLNVRNDDCEGSKSANLSTYLDPSLSQYSLFCH